MRGMKCGLIYTGVYRIRLIQLRSKMRDSIGSRRNWSSRGRGWRRQGFKKLILLILKLILILVTIIEEHLSVHIAKDEGDHIELLPQINNKLLIQTRE